MTRTQNAIGQLIGITDAAGRAIGSFRVDEVEPGRMFGTFTPGPDFPTVEPLFRYFEELVENQVLSLTDEAAERIQAIGPRLADGTPIHDVQFYSDGMASFRLPPAAVRNGAH